MTKSDSLIVLYGRRAAGIQAFTVPVIGAGGEQMHGADGTLHEGALAVAQVVIPHSAEAFVEAQLTNARQRADKTGPPFRDGFAVWAPMSSRPTGISVVFLRRAWHITVTDGRNPPGKM